MGFLAKSMEEQAAAATLEVAKAGGASFLCIRCDRTIKDDLEGLKSSLCGTCRPIMAAARLYPVNLIWGLAVLSGPFTAGGIAALNWWRIGDFRRAKIVMALMAACTLGFLFFGFSVFLPPWPAAGLIWLAIVAAFTGSVTAGLGPLLTSHEAAGGQRGNVLGPIGSALTLAVPGVLQWAYTLQFLRIT